MPFEQRALFTTAPSLQSQNQFAQSSIPPHDLPAATVVPEEPDEPDEPDEVPEPFGVFPLEPLEPLDPELLLLLVEGASPPEQATRNGRERNAVVKRARAVVFMMTPPRAGAVPLPDLSRKH